MSYLELPHRCGYLPDQVQRMEYAHARGLTAEEYLDLLHRGWRRFGRSVFRPRCPACSACRSLRVLVDRFEPDRSQRRAARTNGGRVEPTIERPALTDEILALYDRFHAHQAEAKGWPEQEPGDALEYHRAFVDNPFPTQQWRYEREGRLVGLGLVDELADGLSAIYFFHEPDCRRLGLGTWNVLCLIDRARALGLPYVYLGYYVAGCPSLSYKARFRPCEVLGPDGHWREISG